MSDILSRPLYVKTRNATICREVLNFFLLNEHLFDSKDNLQEIKSNFRVSMMGQLLKQHNMA